MTFFKIKYSFKFVILSIFLALLLTIIPIMGLKNKDVYILIMHCYGTLNVNLIDKIYPITFWILPQIIVLSILGNCIYKDFNKNAAFIFSRADSRTKLLLYKIKRSEEHTSKLQSRQYLVCRLLLDKKTKTQT